MHPMTTVENVPICSATAPSQSTFYVFLCFMLFFSALCDFLAHLCQSSVVREVRQIHHPSVREILDFVHIGLSALNTHIHRHRFFFIISKGTFHQFYSKEQISRPNYYSARENSCNVSC